MEKPKIQFSETNIGLYLIKAKSESIISKVGTYII